MVRLKAGDKIHPFNPRGYFESKVYVVIKATATQAWYRRTDDDHTYSTDNPAYVITHKETGCQKCG